MWPIRNATKNFQLVIDIGGITESAQWISSIIIYGKLVNVSLIPLRHQPSIDALSFWYTHFSTRLSANRQAKYSIPCRAVCNASTIKI